MPRAPRAPRRDQWRGDETAPGASKILLAETAWPELGIAVQIERRHSASHNHVSPELIGRSFAPQAAVAQISMKLIAQEKTCAERMPTFYRAIAIRLEARNVR